MPKLEVKGLDKLERSLKENATLSDVKRVVRHHGSEMQKQMQENADFRGHMKGNKFVSPTGTTKRSIIPEMQNGGFTVSVGPDTEYSPYLEYGTRFMDAQPFVKPAYNSQKVKFKKDLNKLVR